MQHLLLTILGAVMIFSSFSQTQAVELIVVRHGQTDWNAEGRLQGHADMPLNTEGQEQASRLGKKLDPLHFDAVYCSDLLRCVETTEWLLQDRDLQPVLDERLRETCLGKLEGTLWEETSDDVYAVLRGEEHPYGEEAESTDDVKKRVTEAFNEILQRHADDERVLVVTHGGIIRMALSDLPYTGQAEEKPDSLPNCHYLHIRAEDGMTITGIGGYLESGCVIGRGALTAAEVDAL